MQLAIIIYMIQDTNIDPIPIYDFDKQVNVGGTYNGEPIFETNQLYVLIELDPLVNDPPTNVHVKTPIINHPVLLKLSIFDDKSNELFHKSL